MLTTGIVAQLSRVAPHSAKTRTLPGAVACKVELTMPAMFVVPEMGITVALPKGAGPGIMPRFIVSSGTGLAWASSKVAVTFAV